MALPAASELASVTKRCGSTVAVDRINLKIPVGTCCCLLGPSGCGKTSTLRMIAGHEAVSDGDIVLGAADITDLAPAKRGTAMTFQSYALFPHLSVLDNVAFALKMRGVDKPARHARAMDVLKLVAMDGYAGRPPAQLSGGQLQRILRWPREARPSKGDSQILQDVLQDSGRPSFEVRGACHRAALRADPLARASG